jgi:pimeloyl-ACP methyl ester carboxylesterase
MPKLVRPDGAELFWKVVGTETGRPPLVLIHGWCSNHEHWVHQVRHFRKRHRILLLDRRGHGRSTTPGTGHDAAGHAADIAAVIRAAGLAGVIAIGHAGGSPGTLELLRAHPRLARGGVIVDAGLYPLPTLRSPESPFGFAVGRMIDALSGKGGKAAFRRMYSAYFDPRGDRAAARQAVADAARTPDAVKIAELEGMIVDTAAIADGIRQPVLWLTAAGADQAFVRKHLQRVAFAQVYGAHHFPHFEQPAQTNAMIEAFVARNGG